MVILGKADQSVMNDNMFTSLSSGFIACLVILVGRGWVSFDDVSCEQKFIDCHLVLSDGLLNRLLIWGSRYFEKKIREFLNIII